MRLKRESSAELVMLEGKELGSGGEGRIFPVSGEPNLVAKVYSSPTPTQSAKLRAMIVNPPLDPTRAHGHISIAWPIDRLLDGRGTTCGFLMPYIDHATSVPLLKLYNPGDRRRTAPAYSWQYLLRTAVNLARALEALHKARYVIGDLNEDRVQ